ncbi:hypothetical protein DV735_g2517, partial [Chaetothyriales sp. CBS 134920]
MSIAIVDYSVHEFNCLDDFVDALPKFDKIGGNGIATDTMMELFRRHKVDHIFGLTLLHKHSILHDGERLTDIRGTSNPLTFPLGTPSIWKYNPDTHQLIPVEFSIDHDEVNWQDPGIQAFLADFAQVITTLEASQLLGLRRYPGDGYPGCIEFTTGRSNVNLTPEEAKDYLPSGGTREAAWFYTDDFMKRVGN